MKLALTADIHSNARAFAAVLNAASIENVDCLLIAGDLIGYYFEPKKVVDLLAAWDKPIHIVRGNHEDMIAKCLVDIEFADITKSKYGPGIEIAIQQLSPRQLQWLSDLPHPLWIDILSCSMLLCHGSPFDINQYIYPDKPVHNVISELEEVPAVLVLGHTHYPMIRAFGNCLVVNPGSVGQPRNRQPGAHWMLLETESMKVESRVESYDIEALVRDCKELCSGLPYLEEILVKL